MKKNAMLKIAAILMVAVLLTTCAISSTFAKYTTAGTSSDSARVAKFGITVDSEVLKMFNYQYGNNLEIKANNVATDPETSVTTGDLIVAPSAKGGFNLSSQVKGTTEVAVAVVTTSNVSFTGWNIGKVMIGDTEETYSFYCPIIVTVNGTAYNGVEYKNRQADFEADIENAINSASASYAANTNFDAMVDTNNEKEGTQTALDLVVTWEWPYEIGTTAELKAQNDVLDTKLGQAALTSDQIISFSVTRTVTQVEATYPAQG